MRIELQMCIARNLRTLRVHAAISQLRMARDVGLSRETYAAYEYGKITPDAEILYKIALRHQIKMEILFEENPETFVERIAYSEYYDDNLAALMKIYNKLSSFARGMLLEKSLQLLEQDKIIAANRAALNKRLGKE